MKKVSYKRKQLRKKNRLNKKVVIALASAGVLAVGSITGYYLYTHRDNNITMEERTERSENVNNTGKPNYISETAFDGSEEIDERLFEYAFPTDSEGYVSNKDLYEQLGDYKMGLISDRANEIGTNFYSFDYRKVRTDYDTYFNNISSMFRDVVYDDDADQNVVLSEIIADFSDAELQMTADFKTSKFMIYQNGMSTYVRGILTVYVWSCKDIDKVSTYFPMQLKVGEDNTFVYEIELLNSMDSHLAKDMQIFDYYDCKFLNIL